MSTALLESLGGKLDEQTPVLARLDAYFRGTQPAAFLSPTSREALGDRLRVLAVNYPKLAVDSLAERLQVVGFRTEGPDSAPDARLWAEWRRNGMEEAAGHAHTDALAFGRSFVTVWADTRGRPSVTVESATQVAVDRDPATREVTAAVKRWIAGGKAHAVVYEPDVIRRYTSVANVVDASAIPLTGWTATDTIPNPLGVVPVVALVNRGRLLDVDGVSEAAPILDLTDALAKVMSDALITSEIYSRPRRWAVGLEIVEDDDGNPINPFSDEMARVWQSESPETKFGQFDVAQVDAYADLAAVITQQIGALSGLPPHYLGLNGDQPPSADSIRSAEASLVARAMARQRTFAQGWDDVGRLIIGVRDGVDPASVDVETAWGNPETRTPAQAADAAAKLVGSGILPVSEALAALGYTPAQVDRIRAARRVEALDSAGVDLSLIRGDDA